MENKINDLLKIKSEELNIEIVKQEIARNKDLHVLAFRKFDSSYIVWTSYYTGEEKTSYVGFYNGSYDLTRDVAEDVYAGRFN